MIPVAISAIALFFSTLLHDHSFSYFYFIIAICLLLTLIITKFSCSFNNAITLPTTPPLLLFLLFLFWAFLSTYWSPVSGDSLYTASIFLILPSALLVGFWSTKSQQHYFLLAFVLFILISLPKTIDQRFFTDPYLLAPGLFSNKNTNGIFISLLLLPLSVFFLGASSGTFKKQAIGFIIAAGSFMLTLTVSRGALLGLSIGLILISLHCFREKSSLKLYAGLLTYLLSGFLIAEFLTESRFTTRLLDQSVSTDISTISTGRDYLWQSGLKMYLEHPLLGRGLNMFHWLFPQFRHPDAPDLGQFVHNDYLQILIELGPIGLILILSFVFSVVKMSANIYFNSQNTEEKLYTLGIITPCLALFIHSLFSFNLYQPATLLLLGLYLGVISQRYCQINKQCYLFVPAKFQFFSRSGYFGIVSAFSLVVIYFALINSLSLHLAYGSYSNNLLKLENIIQASKLSPKKEEYIALQADLYHQLLAKDTHMFTEQGKQQLLERGLAAAEKASQQNPYRDLNYRNKAALYIVSAQTGGKNFTEIVNAYQSAIQFDPYNLESRLHFADALMQKNMKEKALKVLQGGLEKSYYNQYQNGVLYLQTVLALVATTNNQAAIENLKQQINALLEKQSTKKGGGYTLRAYE